MNALLQATLRHLTALVAFDTRNPPRAIGTGGIFDYLGAHLPGFDLRLTDHGAGAVSLFAQRGKPRILFHVHLDTVPASSQWSADPFALRVTADRAIGLGACDIKGAAAALLVAAERSHGDAAFLFTSDEEANDARCVAGFLQAHLPRPPGEGAPQGRVRVRAEQAVDDSSEPSPPPLSRRERGFDAVLVAEPTRCQAVLAHRGVLSLRLRFRGRAGHASRTQDPTDSAVHQAVRWGAAALDYAQSLAPARFGGLTGLRLNLGRIEGGIKANVIAPEAELRCGLRPLPSMDADELLARLRTLVEPAPAEFEETFRGPPLPAGDVAAAEAKRLAARDLAEALGLPIGHAVDFWTEAALFSAAGWTAIVYGPGDIAQAHAADEFVELSQLQQITERYLALLDHGHA